MTMQAEGKPLRAIRATIDQKYGSFGPSTPTPLPPAWGNMAQPTSVWLES